nr:MAG: RNA-dependent RNA polymerase [Jingmen bat phenuivirus 1]
MQEYLERYSTSMTSVMPTEGSVHLILPLYDSILEGDSNIHVDSPDIYVYTCDPIVLDWTVSARRMNNRFTCSIEETPDSASQMSTVHAEQIDLGFEEARTFPHDYTFRFLCDKTDYRLTDYFSMAFTPQTPDCVMRLQDTYCIMEFTTSQNDSEAGLRRAVSLKWSKYMPDIQTIKLQSEQKLLFHVIAVSSSRVATTVPINFDLVNELCLRYRLARSIYIDWDIMREEDAEGYENLKYFLGSLEAEPVFTEPSAERIVRGETLWNSLRKNYLNIIKEDEVRLPSLKGGKATHEACIRLPLSVAAIKTEEMGILQALPSLNADSLISKVWKEAITDALMHPERFETGVEYINDNYEEVIGETNKEILKERFRVRPILLTEEMYHIGLDGINAKKMSALDAGFAADLKEKRRHKQLGFEYETDTGDIDLLLESNWWLDQTSSPNPVCDPLRQTLADSTSDSYVIPEEEMDTNFYHLLLFQSIVAQQILIAKQKFCKSNEFVLQPIPNYMAFCLVKPTSAEGHIFFSLMLNEESGLRSKVEPKSSTVLCSKGLEWTITEFQSVKFSSLENWIKLPYFYLSSFYTLMEITQLPGHDLVKRLVFPYLMCLSNKSETEEIVTLSRYAYMEAFRLKKNPYKIMSKVPDTIHSRLSIWAIKKLVQLCNYIKTQPVGVSRLSIKAHEADEESIEVTQNSSILPMPAMNGHYMISSLDEMLCECYTGYWVNKNQDQEHNQNLKLYKKIFLMEVKLIDDPEANQLDGIYTGKYHEWDRQMLDRILSHAQVKLARMLGANYQEILEREFLLALSKVSLLELATLKSSNTSSFDEPYLPRSKVLPQIYSNLEGIGTDMSSALKWAFEKVSDSGFLINIFKKAQHGGIREISIMNLQSRVIQYSIESLSRVICSKYEEEAMTHPSSKNSPVLKHLRRIVNTNSGPWVSFFTSADAEKWNQTLSVAKFDYMLCHLLPDSLHPFIHKALNLWTHKQILLDKFTYERLQEPTFLSKDDTYQEMARRVQEGLAPFKSDSPFMEVTTGMLQGLLHFTSSLFHVLVLDFWRSLVGKISQGSCKCSYLVSSDDAGVIYSVKTNHRAEIPKAYAKALKYEALRLAILEHVGVRTSFEKTTFLSPDVFEFNSMWTFGLTQVRASAKYALACITLSDTGTLASRQEQLCSSRQQLLESGVCIDTVRKISFVQGLFYYSMLGAYIHPLFGRWLQIVEKNKDFFSGWFLVDHKMLSGITTVDYLLWDLCNRTDYGSILAGALNETHFEKGVTKSGATLLSSHASFVRSKTYKAILSRMEHRDLVMQLLNDNPAVLFRKPSNKEELRAALLSNYTSTKVVYSLARDRQFEARVFASSAYMISSPCMTLGTAWLEDLAEDEHTAHPKISLLSLAKKTKKRAEYNDEVRRIFFPNIREYERVHDLAERLSVVPLRKLQTPFLKNHTKVTVIHGSVDYACSLLNACVWKWGFEPPKISSFALNNVWGRYKLMYPWLRETLEETFIAGEFANVLQLKETLAHESTRAHILNVNTCNAYGNSSTLISFIRNNWKKGHRLAQVMDTGVWPSVQHLVTQASWIQPKKTFLNKMFRDLFSTEYNIRTIPERLKPYWVWATSRNVDDFLNKIDLNSIVLGGYEKRGYFSQGFYKGRTTWEGTIKGNKIRIVCNDSRLSEVFLEGNLTTYYKIKDDLRILIQDNSWEFQTINVKDQAVIRPNYQAQFLTGKYQAVPLHMQTHLDIKINPVKLECIDFAVSALNSLRLVGTYSDGQHQSSCTLYSSRFFEHIEEHFRQSSVQGPLGKLIENRPLTFAEFKGFLLSRLQNTEGQSAISMLRNLIGVHWLAEKPYQNFKTAYEYEEETDIFDGAEITKEDLMFFKTDVDEEFFGNAMFDEEQVVTALECVEAPEAGTNVIQGLEITPELLLAVNKPETLSRSEYLKLIQVLPSDHLGRMLRKAIKEGSTTNKQVEQVARLLGYKVYHQEEPEAPEVLIDF